MATFTVRGSMRVVVDFDVDVEADTSADAYAKFHEQSDKDARDALEKGTDITFRVMSVKLAENKE